MISVALPKGRLGEAAYALLEKGGYACSGITDNGRKLVFEDVDKGIRYFWVKPSDVAVYVERGVADLGIVGSDILMEKRSDVYELLDLRIGRCRLAVAAAKDYRDDPVATLRVATKYPGVASRYYADKSRLIDVIYLNGSVELAPILGLSDVIVDIVETGATLRENGLEPKETIVHVSARLIANKASFKFNGSEIEALARGLRSAIREDT